MSGGLVGEDSQREVLPLGPLSASVYKYQRYALIFLLNFQTLRRKRKKTSIFWARCCANPSTDLIAFHPRQAGRRVAVALYRANRLRAGTCPRSHSGKWGASSGPSPLQQRP